MLVKVENNKLIFDEKDNTLCGQNNYFCSVDIFSMSGLQLKKIMNQPWRQ